MSETITTTPASEQETNTHPEYREAINNDGELQLYQINPDGTEEWILDEDAFLAERGVADRHSKAELAAQTAARRKHAALIDKVKGPVYRKERRQELLDKHNETEDEYLAAVYEHAYEQVEKATQAGELDPNDMDAIRSRVQATVNDHLGRTQYDEQEEVLKSGGWKGRLLGKYADLSRGKKIAVGVGIGVLGAGAGALLGAAGAAGAVVAGGLAGTRFARGYYTRIADMYVERKESGTDKAEILLSGDDPGQWQEQIAETFKTHSAEDIERYEGIRKRAIKGAIGGVALGASIGAAAGVLGDYISGRIGQSELSADDLAKSREWAQQWWSDESISDNDAHDLVDSHDRIINNLSDDGTTTESLSGGSDNIDENTLTSRPLEGSSDVVEADVEVSDAEKLALALEHQLSQPFMVEAGHGYTHELVQALDGLGVTISPEESYELHKLLVDEVGHQYISGDVYHMGGDQYQWGIGAPGETTWDPRAVEIITQYAVDHGAVVEGIDQVEIIDMPEVDAQDVSDSATEDIEQPPVVGEVPGDDNIAIGDLAREPHTTTDISEDTVDADEVTDGDDAEMDVDEKSTQAEELPQQSDAEQQPELTEVTTDGFDEAVARNESLLAMQGDIHEITNQLDAGNIDAVNNNPLLQKTLMYLQRDLQNVYYPDTSEPLVSFDDTLGGRWVFNPIPEGSYLPTDTIISYLNAYELRISSQS